jgi:hypothetical protein
MDNKYLYHFFLDSPTKTPDLESRADKTLTYSDTYRVYEFNLPPSAGAILIQNNIDDIQTNCQKYKLVLVGEQEGHVEIYKSDDYEGSMMLRLHNGPLITELWKSSDAE